tara:strand:+ start:4257 stop:4817 length:561 start_codon:yes stop_codon:yes gene_type:complete
MKLPKTYKCLKTNIFSDSKFKIIPIRFEDSIEIMNWRNEQIEILRQSEKLTSDKQIEYFSTVVNKLFYEKEPSQLLFSFFYEEELIGYGGLVHIDWENCNSEISFLLKTELNDIESYIEKFTFFLKLVYQLAESISLHKIYTYGYDIDEYRFAPLINLCYEKEVVLKKQKKTNDNWYDVLIYSKFI